jgi:hypothetical protein
VTGDDLGNRRGIQPEHLADLLQRLAGPLAHLLVANQQATLGRPGLECPLDGLAAECPDFGEPADQRQPALAGDGEGAFADRPGSLLVGGEPGVDDVAPVAQEEDQPRAGEELGEERGRVRSGLLDDVCRRPRAIAAQRRALGFEAGGDQRPQRLPPAVAVARGEEVVGLPGLQLEQRGQLGRVLAGGPGQGDRPPDAEVMAEVGIVDRDHPAQVGEHPQQPGAAAARGAEDPDEAVFAVG